MFISWHGLSSFKIQEKETVLIADPYNKDSGLRPPRLANADIITVSNGGYAKNIKSTKDDTLTIDGPGEYEARGIMVGGIPGSYTKDSGKNTIYTMKISDVAVCHLGNQSDDLSDENLDAIDGIDVLLVPIGGGPVISTEQAITIINQIEPRIVIPMYYKIPKVKTKLEPVGKFCKELGVSKQTPQPKVNIKKNNLPQDEVQVIVLSPLG